MRSSRRTRIRLKRRGPIRKLAGWFTGQVLKATGGKANPAVVGQMVAAKLGL